MGKSSLVVWCSQLDPKQYRPLDRDHSALSGTGLLATLLYKLGKVPRMRRDANLKAVGGERRTGPDHSGADKAQNYSRSALARENAAALRAAHRLDLLGYRSARL